MPRRTTSREKMPSAEELIEAAIRKASSIGNLERLAGIEPGPTARQDFLDAVLPTAGCGRPGCRSCRTQTAHSRARSPSPALAFHGGSGSGDKMPSSSSRSRPHRAKERS